MYRPNDAKVRNLKTKDYLGKARLVAATDRTNAFVGFTGMEIKNVRVTPHPSHGLSTWSLTLRQAGRNDIRDDRPPDNISYAATNLVKPGLQSRRQQSEPPLGSRNVFPPTPPPESERSMSRGASVRSGNRPMLPRLNIDRARPSERYERVSPPEDRRGPSRSASIRGYSDGARRRRSEDEEDAYPDDLYDMYSAGGRSGSGRGSRGSRGSGGSRGQRRPNDRYIQEEEEDGSDYDDPSFDEGEFEMVTNRRAAQSSFSGSSRGGSRRPDIRKVRVKVHAEDVRYIMIGTAIEFPDLVDRIRDKFGIRRRFKIKVRDDESPDGDMITMGDQDDLDIAMSNVKMQARKQRQETGKMEVSFD